MVSSGGGGADLPPDVGATASGKISGQVAVITGAGRGIGRAIATSLAQAGADVVLGGRDLSTLEVTAQMVRGLGRAAVTCRLDVRDPETVENLVEEGKRAFSSLDILVCNSGIGGPTAPLWEVRPADWRETLDVNLTGTFLCCRAVLPTMISRGSGAIVLIGSITGKRPLLNRSSYAASKLGLVGLCRTLALELGPHGIRVNVVSPGFVEGDRLDWVIGHQARISGQDPSHVLATLKSASALGRLVSAAEVASAVRDLVSDSSSAITGIDLNVAAGAVMY